MNTTDVRRSDQRAPLSAGVVGTAGFALMFAIGGLYGMSALQTALGDLDDIASAEALLPFGAASLGLAVGCGAAGKALARFGPRAVGVSGTMVWGVSLVGVGAVLSSQDIVIISAILGVGGFGAGLAYLTIVVTVGTAFASTPLIGSAIGPLGFATGTATAMLIASQWFVGASASALSAGLIVVGSGVVALAIACAPGLPDRREVSVAAENAAAAPARRTLGLVLFGNAYPGMMLVGIAVPLLASAEPAMSPADAEVTTAILTIALFGGGILAPALQRCVGAGATFVLLLLIRAAALVMVLLSPTPTMMLLAIAIVLFGHGAGFSVLPGLMRRHDVPARFAANYSRVLVSWGMSGALGAAASVLSLSVTGSFDGAIASSIVVMLITALLMFVRRPAAMFGRS